MIVSSVLFGTSFTICMPHLVALCFDVAGYIIYKQVSIVMPVKLELFWFFILCTFIFSQHLKFCDQLGCVMPVLGLVSVNKTNSMTRLVIDVRM
jgi:hypothetical protein